MAHKPAPKPVQPGVIIRKTEAPNQFASTYWTNHFSSNGFKAADRGGSK